MNKKIIIIVVAVLLVAGGAAFFLLGNSKKEPVMYKHLYDPEQMVTNIKEGKHLLKTAIVLEVETKKKELDDKTLKLLDSQKIQMRDIMNSILKAKTLTELESDEIKDKLRNEIVTALKKELELDILVTIYYNDFVIQ